MNRDNPILVGAIVYRLMGCNGNVKIEYFGEFCEALKTYNLETDDAYHISCDIEDYYEQEDLR